MEIEFDISESTCNQSYRKCRIWDQCYSNIAEMYPQNWQSDWNPSVFCGGIPSYSMHCWRKLSFSFLLIVYRNYCMVCMRNINFISIHIYIYTSTSKTQNRFLFHFRVHTLMRRNRKWRNALCFRNPTCSPCSPTSKKIPRSELQLSNRWWNAPLTTSLGKWK